MPSSVGANELIKNGARMATSVMDVLEAFEAAAFADLDSNAIGAMHYDAKKAANRYGVASKKDDNRRIRLGSLHRDAEEESEQASALGLEKEQKEEERPFVSMSPAEKAIYDCIPEEGEVSMDLILAASGQSVADVTMHLLSLGIKGAVTELPGDRYRRT